MKPTLPWGFQISGRAFFRPITFQLFTGGDVAHNQSMSIAIELEREDDGRWVAEVPALPGVIAYGVSREEALRAVQTLALRVIADRLEQGEPVSEAMLSAFHVAA
jgi:predicted RNase H-like HicB family nuclease